MEIYSIEYALLAVQRALLDTITFELRAVVVDFCRHQELLYTRIYYDGEASAKSIDLWDCAITEASAALGPHSLLDDGVERLDYPQEIPLRGRYAYLRKEPSQDFDRFVSFTKEIVSFDKDITFISPVSEKHFVTNWGMIYETESGSHVIPVKPESYEIETLPVAYALLSVQRALLGKATRELRAIIVDADDRLLYIRLYYDGEVGKELLDLWEFVISQVYADLGVEYTLDGQVLRLDYPQEIPFRGRYAYSRYE